jgi:predicted DNA-binding transcriptional regulator AlpA
MANAPTWRDQWGRFFMAAQKPQQPESSIDPAGLLRLPQVLRLIPVAPSTWWAGVKDGRFPQSVKLGPRTTCWRASDVLALIDAADVAEPTEKQRVDRIAGTQKPAARERVR